MLQSGQRIGMLSSVTCTYCDELVNVCELARWSAVADHPSDLHGPAQVPQGVSPILFLHSVSDPQVSMFVYRVQVFLSRELLRRVLDRKPPQRDLYSRGNG